MANASARPTRNAIWWGARFKFACSVLHVTYEEIIKATDVKAQGTLVKLGHGFKGQGRPVEERTARELRRFFAAHRHAARLEEEKLPVDDIIVPAKYRFKPEFLDDFNYVNWPANLFSLGGRATGGGRSISMYEIKLLQAGGYAVEKHVKIVAGIVYEARQQMNSSTMRSLSPSELYSETEDELDCYPQIYISAALKRD